MKIFSGIFLSIIFFTLLFLGIDDIGKAQCDGSVAITSYIQAYGLTLKIFAFTIIPVYALGFFTGKDD